MVSFLVSIIIPTYNRAEFIGQAIDSALAQTFTDFELIIVNDGSTDNTLEIVGQYTDPRIRLINLETNTGPSMSRNIALEVAQGEFIAFLDSDDVWYPNMLATTVAFLTKRPDIDIVYAACDFVDFAGRPLLNKSEPTNLDVGTYDGFLQTILLGNPFLIHALLIRKSCFDRCGSFNSELKAFVDWDVWLRFALCGCRVATINDLVASYRRHEGNLTRNPQKMEHATREILMSVFANQTIINRFVHLREYAFMDSWLRIAWYCQDAGLNSDVSRYLKMAEVEYRNAQENHELSRKYLVMSAQVFPASDNFMRLVSSKLHDGEALYTWLVGRYLLSQKRMWAAGLLFVKILRRRPKWLFLKILRRFDKTDR